MGSKDYFHKKKAKTTKDLERKKSARSLYERVLIVCEGSKTEVHYFRALVDHFKLNSANVEVDGNSGSSPISVVNYALKRYREEKRTGDGFDKVFCVFDRDTHTTYSEALIKLASFKPKNTFKAIISVPCFEYWLLLHFEYTTKPYNSNDSKSICEYLIDDLENHLPDYSKGDQYIVTELILRTNDAITRSERSLQHGLDNNTDKPTTNMHQLVEYLQNLKN